MQILNLGSCNLQEPQTLLNRADILLNPWNELGFSHTPYALSSGLALQLVDFCLGKTQIDDFFLELANNSDKRPLLDAQKIFERTDFILIELSTPIEPMIDGTILNLNRVVDLVVQPLIRSGIDRKTVQRWASALGQGADEATGHAAAALLTLIGKSDERLARLVRRLRSRRIHIDQMTSDIEQVLERVPHPAGVVLFNYRFMPDGRPLDWPAGFMDDQKTMARRLGLPVLDLSTLPQELGTDRALERDMAHWLPDIYPAIAERYYDFVAKALGRPKFAESLSSWQQHRFAQAASASAPSGATATDGINRALFEIHSPRLQEMGTEPSGLGDHYVAHLEQGSIFGPYEEEVVLMLLEHLSPFDRYAVMQAGLGQLALALGIAGKAATACDLNGRRLDACKASVAGFEAVGLIPAGMVATSGDWPKNEPTDATMIGIAIGTDLQLAGEAEESVISMLTELDGLLIEPRTFLRRRTTSQDQADLVDRISRHYPVVARFPSLGLVYFGRFPIITPANDSHQRPMAETAG